MPFSKTVLAATLKAKFAELRNNTDNPTQANDELAQTIADAVATQVQAMFADAVVVNVPALVSPSGPVTGTIVTTITITVV